MGFLLSYVTEPRRGSSATTESAASLGIALGQHFKRKLTRVKPRRELIKISQICPGDKKRFLTSPFLVKLKKKSIFLPVSAPKIRLDQCPSFAGQSPECAQGGQGRFSPFPCWVWALPGATSEREEITEHDFRARNHE